MMYSLLLVACQLKNIYIANYLCMALTLFAWWIATVLVHDRPTTWITDHINRPYYMNNMLHEHEHANMLHDHATWITDHIT